MTDSPDKHLRPKIGQYALVVNTENKVLLLERERSKLWSLPGGRLDKEDKDYKEAFTREIYEELGLKINEFEPFDVKLIEDKWQTKYCVYFLVRVEDFDKIVVSAEHSKYRWVNKIDIESIKIEDDPKVKQVLEKYFSQKDN